MTFWLIVRRDFLLLCRSAHMVVPLANLGIATLLMHWIGGHGATTLLPHLPGILIFLIFLNGLASVDILYLEEFKRGILEAYYLKGASLPLLITGRFACFYALVMLPSVFLLPLFTFMLGVSVSFLWLFLAAFFSTLLFSALATLQSLLVLGYGSARSLLMILVLPLFVPVFIVLAVFLESLPRAAPLTSLLLTLGGGCLIVLPLCLILGAWALKMTLTDTLE